MGTLSQRKISCNGEFIVCFNLLYKWVIFLVRALIRLNSALFQSYLSHNPERETRTREGSLELMKNNILYWRGGTVVPLALVLSLGMGSIPLLILTTAQDSRTHGTYYYCASIALCRVAKRIYRRYLLKHCVKSFSCTLKFETIRLR